MQHPKEKPPEIGVCSTHAEFVDSMHKAFSKVTEVIGTLGNDVKWLVLLGKWAVSLMGATLVVVIPLLVAFFVYLSGVEKRVSLLEKIVADSEQKNDIQDSKLEQFLQILSVNGFTVPPRKIRKEDHS